MDDHNNKEKASCCRKENNVQPTHVDPVCGMGVTGSVAALQYSYDGRGYYFCKDHCLKSFSQNPERYLMPRPEESFARGPGVKPLVSGMCGTSALLIVFFSIVTLANGSLEAAFTEFTRLWYWVLLLAVGFGFQLGLFFHIKNTVREKMAGATAEVAASGTISTGSMIACCSHGLVNLLPMLGVSAAAAFLARYQQPLILLGVFSNLAGITIMLEIAKKHGVMPDNLLGRLAEHWNMRALRYVTIVVGVLVIIVSTYLSHLN